MNKEKEEIRKARVGICGVCQKNLRRHSHYHSTSAAALGLAGINSDICCKCAVHKEYYCAYPLTDDIEEEEEEEEEEIENKEGDSESH